jgi:hypothetical protein
MRKRLYANTKKGIMICAIAAVVFVLTACLGNGIEKDFKKRSIPVVDGHYSVIGRESGSFFAAWFFAALKMNDLDFDGYRQKIEFDASEGFSVGTEVVVVTNVPGNQEDEEFWQKGVRVLFKRKLNGKYIDWWNTDKVGSGWVYKKRLPDACGYWVMFDDTQKIVYVYWHYS